MKEETDKTISWMKTMTRHQFIVVRCYADGISHLTQSLNNYTIETTMYTHTAEELHHVKAIAEQEKTAGDEIETKDLSEGGAMLITVSVITELA